MVQEGLRGNQVLSSTPLNRAQLEAVARALVDSRGGLTHRELTQLLTQKRLPTGDIAQAKWIRLFNALVQSQNVLQSNQLVLSCVEDAMNPARFIGRASLYETFREVVNGPLALVGLSVGNDGKLIRVKQATTVSDAERRARELRIDLSARGVHEDVLRFCRPELIVDNYFHAVLEATKSVAQKMRDRTGLTDDGSVLVDHVFGGKTPLLVINAHQRTSEVTEQAGFCNLLKGVFGMFRNPTAHEPKILWAMGKEDAEDLLSLISLIHRRIDDATMPPRV